jgi:exosortase
VIGIRTKSNPGDRVAQAGLHSTPVAVAERSGLPWMNWVLLAVSGALAFRPLTSTWEVDPNYSFGWLIPLVALFLFVERWPTRPLRQAPGSVRLAPLLALWGVLFFVFRLAAETDPDWRPGLWMLVGLYVAALLGWLWLYGGVAWKRHFTFPVCFLFLCLPWPFQIEYPLVQGLMRWNATLVSHTLRMIAIPAEPAGNIIQLPNCQLGVEEACSGILSLQASLMMGCLLGEIYRLSVRHRFILVMTSMALALAGNYLRTLFLAMMAFYSGPQAVPVWHDTAGYCILIFTGLGSWLAALGFGAGQAPVLRPSASTREEEQAPPPARKATRLAGIVFALVLLSEAGTQAWFGWRELSLSRHPAWTATLPVSNTFQAITLSDLTLQALRCDSHKAGQWNDAQGWNWTLYWFRYDPKPYTRIVLGWHNPDNCLPSAGLIKDRNYPDFTTRVNDIVLDVQPKKFLKKDVPVYIFWIVYPNRGEPPPDKDTRISEPFTTKFRSHLQDVWNGYRGVGVETMEVAIVGPAEYEAAKAGFLEEIKATVKSSF